MICQQMKEAVGIEVERHPVDQFCYDLCPQLTMAQRLIGYGFAVLLGFILNMGGWPLL